MRADQIEARRVEARRKRQHFEEMHRYATTRSRPADYENALAAAVAYVNSADGLVAALLREDIAA